MKTDDSSVLFMNIFKELGNNQAADDIAAAFVRAKEGYVFENK